MFYNCKLDDKVSWLQRILTMPQSHVPYFFYPRVYRVTDVGFMDSGWGEPVGEGGWVTKPDCRPASLEKLDSRHAYLIDNAEYLYLYLGN